jgi:phosphoribosylaminoimidazolecarboxamide formyltransferase/IMP cyclohydrolase
MSPSERDARPVRRALVSVADKAGLEELGRRLASAGVAIVSSGSTAATLAAAGIPVTPVSDVTGFPEMLDGRVKTLHPKVHAGILADSRKPEHLEQLREQGIEPFDLVVVNLYPFEKAIAAGATRDEAVEQIDIGGPTLVRAAAKNFESVAVIVNPPDYSVVLDEIESTGGTARATRLRLAAAAFDRIEQYDRAIAGWFATQSALASAAADDEDLPARVAPAFARRGRLRYGENPHQRGAVYGKEGTPGPLGGAEILLEGKELSFNNWLDAEAARRVAGAFRGRSACVIVKHNNPCGVAVAGSLADAYRRAYEGDTVSAFGGIVAFTAEVDEDAARAMGGVFTEVVVAPAYADAALAVLGERKGLRVLRAPLPVAGGIEVRPIDGGALVQDADTVVETRDEMKVVSRKEPSEGQWRDLVFAWTVAAHTKSNAIVLARDEATVGVGAGQMNRVYSVDLASRHAGDRARGCALGSDAFFPFRDGIDRAAEAGVAAVVQPGGSMRDEEVLAAVEEHGLVMVYTGRRHFRH